MPPNPLTHPLKADDGDTITSYVAQVDFKAETKAAGIPPGEFDLFNLSVGTFPKVPSMSFAALQTYSNGQQVNGDEQSATGADPAHPPPVLQLAAANAAASAAGTSASSSQPATASTPRATAAPTASITPAWPGIVGLIAGVLALLVSIAVLISNRSRAKAPPSALPPARGA